MLQGPAELAIGRRCALLGVSRSGFYAWASRGPSLRAAENAELVRVMREIHVQVDRTYGSPRMPAELAVRGLRCSRNRAARLMRAAGLRAKQPRRFVGTTDSRHRLPVAPNLVQQDFQAVAPNQLWLSDVTYLATDEGWAFLAVVLPTPDALLRASRPKVLRMLHTASRGHLGAETYAQLVTAARATLGLPGTRSRLGPEIGLVLERLALFDTQIKTLEANMVEALASVPETSCLLSIPRVAPVTAAVLLGSIGDPRAYESSAQILRVAGLSLIERSSGILRGTKRISKRGRPLLRQAAYMFAVRSITKDGLFRAEYEGLCRRNGGQKMKAIVAIMRSGLRLLYSVARDRRMFTAEPPVWRERPARETATA